jgi:hypothetical protein
MRVNVLSGALACLGAGVLSLALADPPATPAAAPASAPTAASPATAATAATTAATPAPAAKAAAAPEMGQIERHFRAEGYSVRMKDGDKLYCKREDVLGTRLSGSVKCYTAEALKAREDADQQSAENAQRAARTGNLPGGS